MTMIRFHLDEHVPHAIAEGLRRRGIDVTTTVDAGLRGATDDVHLAYALDQRRVIVTNDPDFLVLAQEDRPHMGIAYCDQGRRSIGEIIRRLVLLWERYPAEACGVASCFSRCPAAPSSRAGV